MKGERMAKRSALGTIVRKRLSDITNSQSQPELGIIEEKDIQVSDSAEQFINELLQEKAVLVKLIEESNKSIELSGNELRNLRMNSQKLQLQNWNLAQSNNHILAELNLGREKLKAVKHEIVLKDALLKAKNLELQGNGDANCQKTCTQLEAGCSHKANDDGRSSNCNRSRTARSRSMGPSTTLQQGTEELKIENKRRCLRRESATFKSQEQEPAEDMFEIEDAKTPETQPLIDHPKQDGPNLSASQVEKEEQTWDHINETQVTQRSSIGRPLRKAAVKVQSYKEVPVKVKMRRVG
ncbi:hypothetical protein K2173_020755 [Erythroxylum novogranatense]|uniref:Shugoshin C-terminal domain-containing protein n=1 Tax=Erythroxylum novogranatense TaxID=1862640 RepID=A0AAV8TLP5_9ROSI|nr:hypothetical protein K2173_020755 [Erythroxylum novogranatense]